MVEIVGKVVDEILGIEDEQSKVLEYLSGLEMRRKYLLAQVGFLNEDVLTNRAKEKLVNKILRMEMKVSFTELTHKQNIYG